MVRYSRKDYTNLITNKKKNAKRKKTVRKNKKYGSGLINSGENNKTVAQLTDSRIFKDPLVKALGDASKKRRDVLIDTISVDEMRSIREVINNFLENNIPVTPAVFKKLQKYKSFLRRFGREPLRVKKKLLKQNGGFFGLIAPAIASLAGLLPGIVKGISKIF